MEDNAAAKLAAGRKMLKEFQKKKKSELQSEPSLQVHNSPESGTSNINDINFEMKTTDGKHNNSDIELTTKNSHNDLTITGLHDNSIQSSASSFFDKISTNNSSQVQNQHLDSNTAIAENGLPLAGILFTNKHENIAGFFDREKSTSEQENMTNFNSSNSNKSDQNPRDLKDNQAVDNPENSRDMKTLVEISKLQQQLQFHIKTVEFLVSEKSELLEKVNEYEKVLSAVKSESEDLSGRLNISRHRASHLEVESNNLKQKNQDAEARCSQMLHELNHFKTIEHSYKNHQKELEEELQELRTLMNDKVLENKDLTKKIEEMNFQLNSNQLRFQQMLQGNSEEDVNPSLSEKCSSLEKLVQNLQQQLSELEVEKNQSGIQFQEYVQQLNQQVESLNDKQVQILNENERLQTREMDLIHQISDVEKQMQLLHRQNYMEDEKLTKKSMDASTGENQSLQTENDKLKDDLKNIECSLNNTLEELNHSRNQVDELTQTLHQVQSEQPDTAKLNAAIESDRLAAQKATTQNTKMKLDLQHLEKAFEQMTHSKLELAELLQAEKNLSKTLTLKLVENEEILKETRAQLRAKDEEMIRLQAASSDLQKEILKQAQVADRLSHYEAQGQSSELLQTELQATKNIIQTLSDENQKLKKLLEKKDVPEIHSDCNHQSEAKGEINNVSDEYSVTLPTAEAMDKLQDRFTKLMKEVADLSDEKQKLEHIVLQLQGETETICEYIALYQKQRNVLKQREIERNLQVNLLSKERENIKGQLENLRGLIKEFVPNKKIICESDTTSTDKSQTAEKIMDLLTQIKESHLIEPDENCSGFENFHPCPCCSGKLIIV